MDNNYYTTENEKRKRGTHLTLSDRGAIQVLKKNGWSNRAIARELNCSPTTISNELKRGTPERKYKRGRIPGYTAKHGQLVYQENRKRCHRRYKSESCQDFIRWVVYMVKTHKWSLDECVGRARKEEKYPVNEMLCTKSLYNALRAHRLPLSLFDVPVVLKRRKKSVKYRENKHLRGRSIDERPLIPQNEYGHWEGDTVIGRKRKGDAVVFTMIEKQSRNYISIKIPSKTVDSVKSAMSFLREEYGEKFSEIFKTITIDNGVEFDDFSSFEYLGTKVYFAHPYSSWERPQNERCNGLLRYYIPKGHSINDYTSDDILGFADEINAKPRRCLGYYSSEEIFDAFLDSVYSLV